MFNKLKKRVIREIICELIDLCDYYDAQAGAKSFVGQDNTFEVGIGVGIRKAKEKVFSSPQYKDKTNSSIIQIKILFAYSKLNYYLCTAVSMFTIFQCSRIMIQNLFAYIQNISYLRRCN